MQISWTPFRTKYEVPLLQAQSGIRLYESSPKTEFKMAALSSQRDWFQNLFGFKERDGVITSEIVVGENGQNLKTLKSTVNNRQYIVGNFQCPSLSDLMAAAAGPRSEPGASFAHCGSVENIACDDVFMLHTKSENRNALFMAASQFNCLEFAGM